MPDYSKGKIYTIRFFDNDKLIYIGSTIDLLTSRFGGHKRNKQISLYQYVNNNYDSNFKCCYIELYENFPCSCKEELFKKEGEIMRYFISNNYDVINKYRAGGIKQENMKVYNKNYYQENKEKIKEQVNQYSENNKEKVKEQQHLKYLKNAEKIKAKSKERYEKNKDAINEKRRRKPDVETGIVSIP
jgi:hypothetical protein